MFPFDSHSHFSTHNLLDSSKHIMLSYFIILLTFVRNSWVSNKKKGSNWSPFWIILNLIFSLLTDQMTKTIFKSSSNIKLLPFWWSFWSLFQRQDKITISHSQINTFQAITTIKPVLHSKCIKVCYKIRLIWSANF